MFWINISFDIQNSDLNLLFLIKKKHHLEELKEGIVNNWNEILIDQTP